MPNLSLLIPTYSKSDCGRFASLPWLGVCPEGSAGPYAPELDADPWAPFEADAALEGGVTPLGATQRLDTGGRWKNEGRIPRMPPRCGILGINPIREKSKQGGRMWKRKGLSPM